MKRDCVPSGFVWDRPKGGRPSDGVLNHVAEFLRDHTGLGDDKIGRLMGLPKDHVKRRRRKTKVGGRNRE